eukprot:2041673-Rhodomonas_salina.3
MMLCSCSSATALQISRPYLRISVNGSLPPGYRRISPSMLSLLPTKSRVCISRSGYARAAKSHTARICQYCAAKQHTAPCYEDTSTAQPSRIGEEGSGLVPIELHDDAHLVVFDRGPVHLTPLNPAQPRKCAPCPISDKTHGVPSSWTAHRFAYPLSALCIVRCILSRQHMTHPPSSPHISIG